MPTAPLSNEILQAALDALVTHPSKTSAAIALGLTRSTYRDRLTEARRRGLRPNLSQPHPDPTEGAVSTIETDILRDRVRTLETLLKHQKADEIDATQVRTAILQLTATSANPPKWLVQQRLPKGSPGTPTLFLSDLHWGEVVDASQIGGVNSYDIEIAQQRMRNVVTRAIDLLKCHMVNPEYPGLVLALGGDMVTGDIHEELSATNAMEIMPTFVDLYDSLVWAIDTLADVFGKVFVPCVSGNHGRATHKIRAKGRNFTSFDWLLYVMLERHFAKDSRITIYAPNGPDALYKVHNHRYLLTHGDQFRGGDSMIGPLGPITRGDHKKRSRNSQIGQEYDTILMGHWHQDIRLRRLIVNGSLKGYDEYAYSNNFFFEPPSQALWMTHPQHGITFSMPVLADVGKVVEPQEWASWSRKKA